MDPNRIEDKKCMEISLSSSYNNVRSKYYKEYLPFSKEEVRVNVPPDLTQDKWDALCDLYETTTWKVNLVHTKMLIIFNMSIFSHSFCYDC